MGDKNRAFVKNREMGMSVVEAARAAGMSTTPREEPIQIAQDEPSYLDLAWTGAKRMFSDVVAGAGAWTEDPEIEASADEVAGYIGPTVEQEKASADLYADRAKRAEAGEIGNVGHLAGDVTQAIVESSPYFAGAAAAGKTAQLTGRAAYKALSPGARALGLEKVAKTAVEALPGGRRLGAKRVLDWATFGLGAAAFGTAGYYESGMQRAEAEGLDVKDPVVREDIAKQAYFRGALEAVPVLGIFGKLGILSPRVQSGILSFLQGGLKGSAMESAQELGDMALEDAFLNPETIKQLDEGGLEAIAPWLVDMFGTREAAIAALAGAGVGGPAGAVEGGVSQKFHNQKAAQEVKIAAKVLEPMGLGTQELEQLAQSRDGARKLREAVQQIGRVERTRTSHLRQIEQQDADEETITGLRKQINTQLDERIDSIARTLGAPKSLEDVRRERDAQETERRRAAMDRLAQRGLRPKKDLSPEVGEQIANRIDAAEGQVERLQSRLDATTNPERKAETQRELDEALAERQQARIDARIKIEDMTPAQALKAVQDEVKKTEGDRRREMQQAARERAIERQTEIEFPETLAPEAQLQRAQEIIAEAEADGRPDAGLDNKIKRLERQRRAATSPEDVDRLTDEIADLEARRGLPTPAVEAARRVLQAQGLAVPQSGEASGPTAQNAVSEGLQPADAALGPVGEASPAGPRNALDITPTDADVASVTQARDRTAERQVVEQTLAARGVSDPAVRQRAVAAYDASRDAGTAPEAALREATTSIAPEPPIQGSGGFAAPSGLAYKDLTAKMGVRTGLDKVEAAMLEWSQETGFEAGAHVAADGTVLGVGTNEDPNVLMPPANGLNDPTVTFTHTHAQNTPFSAADVRAMFKSGQTFRAVLPDGAVIEMRPLKAYDERAFTEIFNVVRGDLADTMPADMPFLEAAQVRQEAMLQALELAGMIEYVRPFRGLTPTQKETINATVDRTADAVARIGAGVDGRAGTPQAGEPGGQPGQRRAADAEEGTSATDDLDGDEVEELLGDPYDFRHAARTGRKPSVNKQRLNELATSVHDGLMQDAMSSQQKKSPLVSAVRDGTVTVQQIEAGIQAWVENDGYKRMHALGDVVKKMFPDHVIGPKDFVLDTYKKKNSSRFGKPYRRLTNDAVKPHHLALELAEKVHLGKRGYVDARTIQIRNKAGLRFKTGLVVADDRLKNFLEFTTPEHTRFDPPWPADNTSRIKRDVRNNAFDADALEPARRTARYLQGNRYTLDAARIATLTPDDMISKKGLAAAGLDPTALELFRKLNRTPRAQWTDKEAAFMAKQGDDVREKLVIAENKLRQLRRAYQVFKEEHGPDGEVGFLYQVDNRGRIYADGQFNPQGGSKIKAIFKHKGVSLADMTEVDASASGWQINALMARDHIAAPEINLGRGQATEPGRVKSDLYKNTIARVVARIQQDAEADVKSLPASQRIEAARRQRVAKAFIKVGLGPNGKLNRNAIKASVIAVNYGGNKANFSQNLREVFDADMEAFRSVANDKPWSYIGDLAFDSLRDTAPHSLALQEWTTSSIAKLAAAVEKRYPPGQMPPLTFSVGLEGKVRVKKKKTKEAEAAIRNRTAATFEVDANNAFVLDADGNRVIKNTSREDTVNYKQRVDILEADADKIGRAVWANIVQGFDASVLHRAVERYKQLTNGAYITTNHDSFTVPPEHEGAVAAAVRESMLEIMSQVDAPARIYQEIMAQAAEHGVDVDVQPFANMGQYNMDDLMTSTPVFGDGAKGEDYIPDYAEIPEDAPVLRRAVDEEVPAGGVGVTPVGSPPASVPVRGQGASSIADLAPEVRRAVDVADYMASLPQTSSVLTKVQAAAASPQVANRNLMQILEDTVFNSFAPIRRLEIALKGKLPDGAESAFKAAEMAVNDSGRQEALLYYGAAKFGQHGEYAVAPGTMGLKDIFKLAGGDGADRGQRLQDWMQWMVARRAQDLAKRGIKTPLTPQDIQTALAKGANIPEFQRAADEWKKFNDANLDFLEASGRINGAQKAAMQADDFYVPFYRSDERVDGTSPELVLPGYRAGTTQAGILKRDPGIKAIKGGDKLRIDNLMQNMIRNSQAMVGAAMRNKAANQTFELMEQAGMARVVPISAAKPDPNAVRIWKNGVESWAIPEGREAYPLMTALAGMQPVQLNAAMQLMADIASIFRQGITLTPPFMIRNAIRGAVSSGIMTSGANLTLTSNTVTGFRDAYNNGQATQAFKAQAGMGDYRFGNSDAGFGKDDILIEFGLSPKTMGSRFRKFMEKMEHVGSATELADRVAARETMIKNGMRPDEASYQALTIMNYSRKGNSQALRAWLPLVPFFNARLQGLSRMAEGAVGKRGMAGRKQALAQMALNGLVYSIISGAIWAWNSNDDERREKYVDEPLFRRLNYHIIYMGDKALYIPKAFELGHVFSSIPELFGDAFIKQDMNEIGPGLKKIVTDTVTMNMIPAAALPIIEGLTNYSFFRQAELEGMRESNMRPSDRTAGASALTRLVGRDMGVSDLTGISPTMIEHWASSYGGIYYVMLSTAIDSVAADLGLMPVRPGGAFGDTPVLSPVLNKAFGSFLRDSSTTTTKWIEEFYRTKDWITQIHRSATAAKDAGDIEYANRLLAEAPGRPAAYKLVNKAGTDLSEINARLRKIRDDRSMSREEKRKRETELIQRRNEITKNVMRTIREIEEKQGATFRSVQ